MRRYYLFGDPCGPPRCRGRAPLEPFPCTQLSFHRSRPQEIITNDSLSGAEIITSITGFFPPALEVSVHARRPEGHTMDKS